MTRILCITANYPPHSLGGYELSCQDVMERLARRGHGVTVLTSDDRLDGVPDPPGERNGTPRVRRDLRRYWRDGDVWTPPLRERLRIERHNQRVLADAMAELRPEVIAVWHIGALSLGLVTAAIESRVPIVYAVCDDWPAYAVVLDPWFKLIDRLGPLAGLVRRLTGVPTAAPDIGRSGGFCFVSESTRLRNERFSRWTFPDAVVVYGGIDRQLFRPGPPHTWGWRLLFVGRFDERKGLETVIRAMAVLPDSTTLLAQGTGDDTERARLDALATELGVADRIELTRAPREALPARYAAADVFVFPSEWEEPFGMVPLEAMACGTPVVATGTGGSGEFLVDGRNCLRFAPGDAPALAAAITRLADDPVLRDRLIDGGLRTAEYFDADHLADTFEAWYVAAAAGYPDGRPPGRGFGIEVIDAHG